MEKRAAGYYSAALPYHNFHHAMDAVRAGWEIVDRCREEGIRIDEVVVYYALLFHDAGYHEDHLGKGYRSKEDYSADLAASSLKEHGVPMRTIQKVMAAIRATQRDAQFTTSEQKAVRAADLAGLAADYPVFRANTEKLRAEYQMLTGKHLTWEEWIDYASETVRFFLAQEIRLTSYFADKDGESLFHKRARANVETLRAEKRGN